jgi:non-specific serine/threonine protein kinase
VSYRYRFGTAEFDEAGGRLSVDGAALELEQRPLQVLALLLAHPGEVVTREELFASVWSGRPTVDNVLANAMAKLRKALGPANAARIQTLPRVGYRLDGPVERIAVGRRLTSRLALASDMPLPGREHFRLQRQLGPSADSEVWLARHDKTGEQRVYKFGAGGESLAALKREATISRLLYRSLGERDDFARVIDWNFATAPFYLECEYGGPNLRAWAGGEDGSGALSTLTLSQRLELFLQIADATAAAHGVGVLHRDLKPANVLISPVAVDPAAVDVHGSGGRLPWQVRLTDFGSGRLLEPDRLDQLGITALGLTLTQLQAADASGTALYLAPELLTGHAPTVQSDLYALGLMLYQLVTADLRRPLAPGWEQEVPDELLREDIAAATDGNPARRLHSVAELCQRLRTRMQRLQQRGALRALEARAREAERLLERDRARRPWVITAGALLCAGLALTLWQSHRTRLARDEARRQAGIAAAVNRFMAKDLIGAADPLVSGRRDVTVIEAARTAIPKLSQRLGNQSPAAQAALHLALGNTLSGLSDAQGAVTQDRRAVALFERVEPPDPAGLTEARLWLAYDLSRIGQYREANALMARIDRAMPQLVQQHLQLQLHALEVHGTILSDQGDVAAAYVYDQRAWTLVQALPGTSDLRRDQIEFDLAQSQSRLGQLAAAEATLRDLIARQTGRLGPHHPQTLYSQALLADNLVSQRRLDEAVPLLAPAVGGLTAALGAQARRTLLAQNVLAGIALLQRRFHEAAAIYGQVAAGLTQAYGPRNRSSIAALEHQAIATQFSIGADAAEPLYRSALHEARALFKEDNPLVQHLRFALADCLLTLHGSTHEAAVLLAGLDPRILDGIDRAPTWDGRLAYENGRALLLRGHAREALAQLQKAEPLTAGSPEDLWVPPGAVQAQIAAARAQLAGAATPAAGPAPASASASASAT